MTTDSTDAARARSGIAWRICAVAVGPALLLAAIALPMLSLWTRLPADIAGRAQRLGAPGELLRTACGGNLPPGNAVVLAEYVALFAVVWIVVLLVSTLAPRQRRPGSWAFGLPVLYGLGAALAGWLAAYVSANVGRHQARDPQEVVVAAYAVAAIALVLGQAVGGLIGHRLAVLQRSRLPRSASRTVWMSEVTADAAWWTWRAILALAASPPSASLTSGSSSLPSAGSENPTSSSPTAPPSSSPPARARRLSSAPPTPSRLNLF